MTECGLDDGERGGKKMKIGRILAPVHSLGPGERIAVWMQGCQKGCLSCIAPDLQGNMGKEMQAMQLAEVVLQLARVRGFRALTVSGGDPLEQAEELLAFLGRVREQFEDILIYTGFTYQEIMDGSVGEAGIACLRLTDVLIDGRYVQELNSPNCVLRGSSNQVIHFLNGGLRDCYEMYMKKGRQLETFSHGNEVIVTGIMNREDGQ